MPSSWVLSLSFEFFLEFWRKWLEFWILIKILNAVLLSFVGPLGLSICNSSKFTINETFYTKDSPQKCRNFELFSWVLSFFLEFWVIFSWVFFSIAKNQAWLKENLFWLHEIRMEQMLWVSFKNKFNFKSCCVPKNVVVVFAKKKNHTWWQALSENRAKIYHRLL